MKSLSPMWMKFIESLSVSTTHSWTFSAMVMMADWWSVDCEFKRHKSLFILNFLWKFIVSTDKKLTIWFVATCNPIVVVFSQICQIRELCKQVHITNKKRTFPRDYNQNLGEVKNICSATYRDIWFTVVICENIFL